MEEEQVEEVVEEVVEGARTGGRRVDGWPAGGPGACLEDRIVDRLGGEVRDEGGEPLEQRDPHLAVGVGEELDDGGHHL